MKSLMLVVFVFVSGCSGSGDSPSDGVTGPKGDTGDTGATGPTGPQGPAGAEGLRGLPGIAGAAGAAGVAGPVGPQGPGGTGPQGVAGTPGVDGQDGIDGAPGQSTIVLDANNVTLGFPTMIDRGTGMSPAVFAHQAAPAASYPQDKLISATPLVLIAFTGGGCTGTAHMKSDELSATFGKNVGYVLVNSSELYFPTNGTIVSPTMASFSTGGGICGSGNVLGPFVALTKNAKTFTLNKPWLIEHN